MSYSIICPNVGISSYIEKDEKRKGFSCVFHSSHRKEKLPPGIDYKRAFLK